MSKKKKPIPELRVLEFLHHRKGREDKAIETAQKRIIARFVSKNE